MDDSGVDQMEDPASWVVLKLHFFLQRTQLKGIEQSVERQFFVCAHEDNEHLHSDALDAYDARTAPLMDDVDKFYWVLKLKSTAVRRLIRPVDLLRQPGPRNGE